MSYESLLARARTENVLNSVLFELTFSCNLDCAFCYNDLGMRGQRLSLAQYKAMLDELADMQVFSITFSGGEPLLYKDFFELGAYAKLKGFVVRVKSNGIPINERNAHRLAEEVDPYQVDVSLHGSTAEVHERQTRVKGSFNRLLKNVELMKSLGMRVKFNSALTVWNEHQVEGMFALADRLGVPLQFDPDITPRDDGDMSPLELSPSREGIANMMRLAMQRARRLYPEASQPIPIKAPDALQKKAAIPRQGKVCGAGSTNLIVDPFGNVYPCVQFRRKAGNIHEQGIAEIWNQSPVLEEIRELAKQAYQVARSSGQKAFCMGINELRSGDPLVQPASKIALNAIQAELEQAQLAK